MGTLIRAVLLASLVGCGGSASTDGGVDAGRGDVAATDVPAADDAGCALTPPAATLPMVNGRVMIEGGDAGMTPTPSGGDPEGRWLIDDATLWLPAAAQGQVDAARSWIRGSGWATLEGGQYQLSTDLGFRVEAVVGGLTRGVALGGRGRYEVRGTELALTPICQTSAAAQGSLGAFRFSRDAPNRGRLFVELVGMAGRLTLIFQLQRAP
ncbi:MAG: hypothetical protein U0325_10955 [Polyangiales bacterium]